MNMATLNKNKFYKLEIIETLLYYDQPLLFYCGFKNDALYLGMLIDNNGRESSWYYVQVTERTIGKLKADEIDLLTALKEPENETLFKVTLIDNEPVLIESLNSNSLPQSTLPDKGLYIGEYFESLKSKFA